MRDEGRTGGEERIGTEDGKLLEHDADVGIAIHESSENRRDSLTIRTPVIQELDDGDVGLGITVAGRLAVPGEGGAAGEDGFPLFPEARLFFASGQRLQ